MYMSPRLWGTVSTPPHRGDQFNFPTAKWVKALPCLQTATAPARSGQYIDAICPLARLGEYRKVVGRFGAFDPLLFSNSRRTRRRNCPRALFAPLQLLRVCMSCKHSLQWFFFLYFQRLTRSRKYLSGTYFVGLFHYADRKA